MTSLSVLVLLSCLVYHSSGLSVGFSDNTIWSEYKATHGKSYESVREDSFRQKIFQSNLNFIAKHNIEADLGIHSFRLGVNRFADLTNSEYRKYLGLSRKPAMEAIGTFEGTTDISELPKDINWVEKGLVTHIKNQEQCGSCWAFSTVATVEGQHAKATGKLVSLSEQQLLDCAGEKYGNLGCQKGGDMRGALQYIIDNKGIEGDKDYPYEGEQGKCRYDPAKRAAGVTGYVNLTSGDENKLQQAVAEVGPISVGIDAGSILFQLYSHGVYDDTIFCHSDEESLNHGVAAVGYGNESGKDFWLVKNSWGEGWGMKGYIKMRRNRKNQCGIATYATYPLVK